MENNSWKTAITRIRPSSPIQWVEKRHKRSTGNPDWNIFDTTIGQGGNRILDYGCGKGFDADYIGGDKYDPHWFPARPGGPYDVVFCTYVLNVVDKPERTYILEDIDSLLSEGGMSYVTVRRDIPPMGLWHSRGYGQYYVLGRDMFEAGYQSVYRKKNAFEIYVKGGYGEY